MIKQLRKLNMDFGCSINPGIVELAVMFLAGIPRIAVFKYANTDAIASRTYDILRRFAVSIPYYIGAYVPKEYLRLLEAINIYSHDTQKYLNFTKEGDEAVMKLFSEHHFHPSKDFIAALSPGAGTKIKQWPRERFGKIGEYLHKKYGAKIVVIGGPKDREEIDGMIASMTGVSAINCFNQSLDELKALLSKANLIVANDSGPVYISESFGVATLVVVGPTDENEHPPKGPRNRVVTALKRGDPELRGHLGNYDLARAREQIEDVTIEQVEKEIDSLMSVIKQ